MLGFDALGRLALGQLDNITEHAMTAEVGEFIVSGKDAEFGPALTETRRPLYLRGQSYWKGRS